MYKYEDFCRGKLVSSFTTAPSTIDIEEDTDFPGDNRFPTSGQFTVSIWTEDENSPQQDPNRATAVLEHSEENTYNVIEFNEFGTIDFSAGDFVALVVNADGVKEGEVKEWEDKSTDPDWEGVKYKIVVEEGETFLEVTDS